MMQETNPTHVPFSDEMKARFARELTKFPADQKQSAVMACLTIVQAERGYVSRA